MNELLSTLLAQTEAERAPLAGPNPGGVDLWHEPELEPLQAEVRKLEGLNAASVDWSALGRGASQLLASRTKDVRLAAWVVAAALGGGGWLELARALVVLRAIVRDHWETAFPSRVKARVNQLVWLYERAKGQVGVLPVTEREGDAIRLCEAMFRDIDESLKAKASDAYPGLGPLQALLRQRVGEIPVPLPPPPPPSPSPSPSPPSVASAALPVAPPVVEVVTTRPAPAPLSARVAPEPARPRYETPSPSTAGVSEALSDIDGEFSAFEAEGVAALDAGKVLLERATALGELGRAIGKAEPARALAYRLVRAAAWLPLEKLPGRGGKLGTPSSPYDVREAVRRAIDEGDWAELLRRAEDELLLTPLWLDLQRYVAVALEQLGPAYRAARDEVGAASAALAYRHPEALSYSFDDDSPVADDETRAWFEAEAKRWAKGGWLFAEDVAIDRRSREARELAAAGRLEEGLGLAAEIARRGADPRARFLGRLELARLAMAHGAHDLARPVMEALVLLIERHHLDEWEPALAASAYEELVRCLRTELGRAGVDDAPAREASVFEKLCRLDPAAALRALKPT